MKTVFFKVAGWAKIEVFKVAGCYFENSVFKVAGWTKIEVFKVAGCYFENSVFQSSRLGQNRGFQSSRLLL